MLSFDWTLPSNGSWLCHVALQVACVWRSGSIGSYFLNRIPNKTALARHLGVFVVFFWLDIFVSKVYIFDQFPWWFPFFFWFFIFSSETLGGRWNRSLTSIFTSWFPSWCWNRGVVWRSTLPFILSSPSPPHHHQLFHHHPPTYVF